jgi:DNA-binding NarL/FixJ family response regulator
MKVMIIDSATEARRQIRVSIGAIPCEVCESASAEDAIQQCDRFQPDCLTIGLRLAGMSGFSAMRVLRALCPTARMIVVAEMAPGARSRRESLRAQGRPAGLGRTLA